MTRASRPRMVIAVLIAGLVLLPGLAFLAGRPAATMCRAPPAPPPTARSDGIRIVFPADRPASLAMPQGRRLIVRSLLDVPRRMQFGDYRWNDSGVPNGPLIVRVDLSAQIISVFRAGHEIGTAVILYGDPKKPSPTGMFRILQKARRYHSHSYDADMPYMLRLTRDGVAIHGSDVRPGYGTHGCIGVPLAFARRLFEIEARGNPIAIMPPS